MKKVCLSLFVAVFAASTPAQAAGEFYDGKTVTLLVGSDVGGGFDTFARLMSRHMGRYIPGAPSIMVQNMPGAGSAKAAGFLASAAPKDGTVIGALNPGGLLTPLFSGKNLGFDAAKLQFLGSADTTSRVCFTMKGSRVKSFADAQTTPMIVGAAAVGSSSYDYAYLHKNLNKAQFKIVGGYKGMSDILLAMERGEVEGVCGYDWSGLKSVKGDMVRNGAFNFLLQVSVAPAPELEAMKIPQAADLAGDAQDKEALELVAGQQYFGRPYAVAAEVPAERVAILRQAFMATMDSADFLADLERLKLDVTPASGPEVQRIIEKMYAATPATVERANRAIRP